MNNQSIKELQFSILQWARDKNLLFPENAPKQRLKLIEECGELANAILKNDVKLQKDAIGDIFVVLAILAEQINEFYDIDHCLEESKQYVDELFIDVEIVSILSTATIHASNPKDIDFDVVFFDLCICCIKLKLDLLECVNLAYNEIKDRTGKTVNGTFIKN